MTPPLRILVTGATGCAGSHLCELAQQKGAQVFGFARSHLFPSGVTGRQGDITQPMQIEAWLAECRPDRIYHLASLVHGSGDHAPEHLLRVNIEGTYHLLEATRKMAPGARVLVAGSSGIYGQPADDQRPITETDPLQPRSIYAVSKGSQDLMAAQFSREHSLSVVRARTFNQTGPGEPDGLICATLARQVARIEAGLQDPVLRVRTLKPRRDFCDVRDVVSGYWAAMENGSAGEAYNICSGQCHSIQYIVEILLAHAKLQNVRIEESDPHPGAGVIHQQVGNPAKLMACSDWEPRVPLEQSLKDLLREWRLKIKTAQ
jgi:GDP-4-dehydro-6-deoxy-D-mannose reductase